MSVESASLSSLERSKRVATRSLAALKGQIDSAMTQNPSEDIAHKVGSFLESFKKTLDELKDLSNDIVEATDTDNMTDVQIAALEEKIFKEYESQLVYYSDARGKVNAMFSRLTRHTDPPPRRSLNSSLVGDNAPNHPSVKLPDIQLKPFDGRIQNFTEWHSLFETLIDSNENLTPVQKLYFLKNAMTGDAQNLLKDVQIQEGLYESTWKFVKERYFNKRVIIATHFRDLLDLPSITFATLRSSLDRINAIIRGLKVCSLDVEKMSPLIAYIVVRKLPERLRTDWENSHMDYSTYPSFDPLCSFLQNRCFSYESTHSEVPQKSSTKPESEEKKKSKTSLATVAKVNISTSSPRCLSCEKNHYMSNCPQFLEKSVADRFAFVREKRLCLNCLRQYHVATDCNSSKCKKCNKPHHTLLHRENSRFTSPEGKSATKADESKVDSGKSDSSTSKSSLTTVAARPPSLEIILLPSAVVLVRVGSRFVKVRVLIDPASQVNLVSESFVKKHRIASRPSSSNIAGVAPYEIESIATVSLHLKSRINNYQLDFDANVVGRIPYHVTPDVIKCIECLESELPLADCHIDSTSVDMLIGAEFSNSILLGKKKFFGNFCLEESRFGWVAEGPLNRSTTIDSRCCTLTVKVENALSRFWEVEEVEPPKPIFSEHELCDRHFCSTHSRLVDGQFDIRLPIKKPVDSLANTYHQARAALLRFETSLDPATRSMYVDFMQEYLRLNHMELATKFDVRRYHIPHLPVLRAESSTTKFRAVFNASAKNRSGISLNEALMTGPTLQPDLFDILLQFRSYPIAFSADISKMYRQISVHLDDRPLQSILWRDNPNLPIQVYQLTTLTYGTAPASFIATKCLQVLADEIKSLHPDVSLAISSEFYMDDLLTGADSIDDAITKRQLIQSTLDSAHFPLRKYVSNSPEFLASLDPSLVESIHPVEFASSGAAKLLGLQWQPINDCFFVNVKPVDISNLVLTKRAVSSLAAKIFDPLGFAAPVIIRAKILLQDLWREGKEWDDPISPEIDRSFREYYNELVSLPLFKVPRGYFTCKASKFDLVGFCDASNRAYGAVIYLRVYYPSKIISILVCAKSKVAPLKQITIPRLELLGSVLLTKLLSRVGKVLKYDITSANVFCDSTIVLAWLKGPSSKYQTFVRNRVEFVNSIISIDQWNYVKSAENPADLLTRGLPSKSLIDNTLWLNGPEWLTRKSLESSSISLPEELPELRKACNVIVSEFPFDEFLIARYSDFDKLVRIVSLVCKFIFRLYPSLDKFESLDTRTRSIYVICHISQNVCFSSELQALKQEEPLPSKSPLLALEPFIDSFGLLRVGGRLRNSKFGYDTQHPIILSRRSILAEFFIRYIHEKYFHASRSFTLAFLQTRYWIVGGASRLVKKVVNTCVLCTRMKGESLSQLMGDLPKERSSISRPFAYSGVDFAGPFSIKCTNHRSLKHLKHYAAFFVCLTTRAVHLEPVSDLSTKAFLATFQRFSSRRGIPNTVWSDNATNFVGAKNVLENYCQSLGIVWKFIPARSPHHGGIWESAVKSGKRHLVTAVGNNVLNAEEFTTLLTQVESIMNSRPLYRKRDISDPDAIDVLTPGHFLVGSHLLHAATPETFSVSLTDRFNYQSKTVQAFWNLWSKSYLALLQSRSKWKTSSPNSQIGDIVLLKDDSPPMQWRLGRIVSVWPDSQSRSRIVEVTSNGSTYQRSIQKLIKLPVETT